MPDNLLDDIKRLSGLYNIVEQDHPVPPEEVSPILFAKGKSFKGMDPDIVQRFKNAAQEYYAITGKRPTVTSAHRPKEWNDELIRAWDRGEGAKYGLVRRPSETSAHISGNALDSSNAAEMDELGLLAKHGLYRFDPKGDPVHISKIPTDNEPNPVQTAKKIQQQPTVTPPQTMAIRSEPGPRGIPRPSVTSAEPTPFDTTSPIPVKTVSTKDFKPKGQTDMDKLDAFAKLNNIRDITKTIHPGQVFKLPDGSNYTVQRGDSIWGMANGKLKGAPTAPTPSIPSPSTVAPDTEKPIKSTTVDLDQDEIAAQNKADMEYLRSQGADVFEPSSMSNAEIAAQNKADMEYLRSQGQDVYDPSEFPDTEIDNMRDRMLQNLPKQEPNIPEPVTTPQPSNDRLDKFSKETDKFGGEEIVSPLTGTPVGTSTGSFKGDMGKLGIDVTPQKPGEPSVNKNKPETGGEAPKRDGFNPEPLGIKFNKFGVPDLTKAASAANSWLDTNVREPLAKAGVIPQSALPQKTESNELNNIRKLAGLKGN